MSIRPVKTTILCEDLQHATFVRRFLMSRGWTRYDIYVCPLPCGQGSAAQWVIHSYPDELRKYRSVCKRRRSSLIVVIDADNRSVKDRIRELENACEKVENTPPRRENESVLFVIPKRNIETWLAYLRGAKVDEIESYTKYSQESECQPQVERLNQMCRNNHLEGSPPASLVECCTQFKIFWNMIQ